MISFSNAQFQLYYKEKFGEILQDLNKRRFTIYRLFSFLAVVLLMGILINIVFELFVLTILIIGFCLYGFIYVSFLWLKFNRTCKISLTSFIMKFFMGTPEISNLRYDVNQWLNKKEYLESGFFSDNISVYKGYGQMEGKVGDITFRLSELQVLKNGKMDGRLRTQFEGFFLHGKLPFKTSGAAIIWSRKEKHAVHSAIKQFTWLGAENKDAEQPNQLFKSLFATYAFPGTSAGTILSEEMMEMMAGFIQKTGRSIYFSYVERDIYVAVSAPVNLLTMPLFKKFKPDKSILTFLELHHLIFSILQEFEIHH